MRFKSRTDTRFFLVNGGVLLLTWLLSFGLAFENKNFIFLLGALFLVLLSFTFLNYIRGNNYTLKINKGSLLYQAFLQETEIQFREIKSFELVKSKPKYSDGYSSYIIKIRSSLRPVYIGLGQLDKETSNDLIGLLKERVPIKMKKKSSFFVY